MSADELVALAHEVYQEACKLQPDGGEERRQAFESYVFAQEVRVIWLAALAQIQITSGALTARLAEYLEGKIDTR
jgi:hypothetical protein